MNTIKRYIASSSKQLQSSFIAAETPNHITSSDLPPVIHRYIKRHLDRCPASSSTTIPNPFLSHRIKTTVPATTSADPSKPSSPRTIYVTPRISNRRRKLLEEAYHPWTLPPSTSNTSPPPQIRWSDGLHDDLLVSWSGKVPQKETKWLYDGRRKQFKGHKHERQRPERAKQTEERLQGMEKRIDDWKKTRSEAKAALKPALPF